MTAQKLFLHVGHGKTGTSAIQTAFAINKPLLKAHGICYPDHPSLEKARQGKTTSGNARGANVAAVLDAARHEDPEARVYLMSNEQMFDDLTAHLDQIAAIRAAGVEISILLMIRDPYDDVVSTYGQSVKKRGYVNEFGRFLNGYHRPLKVHAFLEAMDNAGLTTTVMNYSRRKRALTDSVLTWLGVDLGAVEPNPLSTVNRSLTASETGLQRAFNKHLGNRASVLIADVLAERFPEKKGEKPRATKAHLSAFKDRLASDVKWVNERLPENERYQFDDLDAAIAAAPTEIEAQVRFSQEEIDVLARSLSRQMFPDGTADVLTDVVMRGRDSGAMSEADQIALLRLAAKAKPKSAKIKALLSRLGADDKP